MDAIARRQHRPVSRISMSLPYALLKELDRMVSERGFISRSQAINDMLHQFLIEHKRERGDDIMIGTVTLVYDNSVPGLQKQLADLQSRHIDEVISSLHVHLVRNQTMEVILLQGPVKALQGIADEMISRRGVISGKMHLVAALMPRIHSPFVGILWDTHHPWKFFDEPLSQTWDRLRPWVWHTHWKDSVSRPAVPARESSTAHEQSSAATAAHALMSGHREADYVLFGGGEFPAEECARLLKTSGYDGWLSLEWEKMWHPQLEVPEVALPLFANKMRALWERL